MQIVGYPKHPGIINLTAKDIFSRIKQFEKSDPGGVVTMRVSCAHDGTRVQTFPEPSSEGSLHAEFVLSTVFLLADLELYCETLRDLLAPPRSKTKLRIRMDPNEGLYVEGLSEQKLSEPQVASLPSTPCHSPSH